MSFQKKFSVPVTNGISTLDATVANYWDTSIANAVDGGSGGAYSPLSELDIGGSGLGRTYPSTGTVSGLAWDTFFNDTAADGTAHARSFDRVHSCVDARFVSGWNQIITVVPQAAYLQGANSGNGAMVPLDVFDGAVLTSITVNFGIVGGHGGLPATFPSFQILQVAKNGTVTVIAGGALSAGSIAAYEALTSFTITCSASADRTAAAFWFRMFDEQGLNALNGNRFHSVVATQRAAQFKYP